MERKETVAKMQESATALAERVREAKLDERAAELAALARSKVREAELDAKVSELAGTVRQLAHDAGVDDVLARVRDSSVAHQAGEAAAQVSETARGAADRTLDRVGEWIGEGDVGRRMGLRRRRRVPSWAVLAGTAVAAGIAAGVVMMRKAQEEQDDAIWGAGEFDTATGGDLDTGTGGGIDTGTGGGIDTGTGGGLDTGAGDIDTPTTPGSTPPGVGLPLEERVREALGQDSRTSSLPPLNVNVVDGTVFVRGTVPAGIDEEALRSVIAGVEGVTDVDLQVTATT